VLIAARAVRFSTYDGIDTCGTRLAEEIRALVASQQELRRISIIAHSMGGLISRYALGMLFNPASSTICGLTPCHFVTLATPHCGCDADGVSQVTASELECQ
jgi:esterase/lipase superfamily enzyme